MRKFLGWVLFFVAGTVFGVMLAGSVSSSADDEKHELSSLLEMESDSSDDTSVDLPEESDGVRGSGVPSDRKQFYKDEILGLGGAVGEPIAGFYKGFL